MKISVGGGVYIRKNTTIQSFNQRSFSLFLFVVLSTLGNTILKSQWRFIKSDTFYIDFPSQLINHFWLYCYTICFNTVGFLSIFYFIYIYIYIYIVDDNTIYTLPMGVEHSGEGIVGRIMQSSSKELSTLVADRVLKCKQTDAAAVAT